MNSLINICLNVSLSIICCSASTFASYHQLRQRSPCSQRSRYGLKRPYIFLPIYVVSYIRSSTVVLRDVDFFKLAVFLRGFLFFFLFSDIQIFLCFRSSIYTRRRLFAFLLCTSSGCCCCCGRRTVTPQRS